MAENIQHGDFGEKIGGAKKDLWKDRGLYVDDLSGMNEREAEKFVRKDNIWKKPDYQAMLDDGSPVGTGQTLFLFQLSEIIPDGGRRHAKVIAQLRNHDFILSLK